jgi:hypothetical protein
VSERKQFYVYIYKDPRDGKQLQPIYVGKGAAIHRRAYFHWEKYAANPLLAAVLNKIKSLGLKPVIEIYEWFDDEKEALSCEYELICKYKSRQEGGTLCNLFTASTRGGFCHSEETKERIREARARQIMKPCSDEKREKIAAAQRGVKRGPNPGHSAWLTGRKLCDEHKNNISKGNLGRKSSEETKDKIRQSNLGQKRTLESREKMRQAQLGKKQSDETRLKRSDSLREAWAKRKEVNCPQS